MADQMVVALKDGATVSMSDRSDLMLNLGDDGVAAGDVATHLMEKLKAGDPYVCGILALEGGEVEEVDEVAPQATDPDLDEESEEEEEVDDDTVVDPDADNDDPSESGSDADDDEE